MDQNFNKNDKQLHFNKLRGTLDRFIDGAVFCGIVLKVGHDIIRDVHVAIKKKDFDILVNNYHTGDRVCVRYFLSSKEKGGKWYTTANYLDIERQ